MNELRNLRIWLVTQRKLNRLAQLRGEKQVSMLDRLVNEALTELKVERPNYADEIDALIQENSPII